MKSSPFILHPSSSILRSGFTLIELMISIAIVLILMLGINFVFSTSARTVSTGMALSSVGRDMRNARKVFENDFNNAVTADEMPALQIHSEWIYAWRDRRDKLADYDNDPGTYDIDGDQANGDEIVLGPLATPNLPGLYNFRRHRQDRFSFFVRNTASDYTRQTGDDGTYIAADTSPEAWISYGLLRLAANNGIDYWKPGARNLTGTPQDEQVNPNNFFASQWILGRKLMLLKDETALRMNSTFFPGPGLPFGSDAAKVTALTPAFSSGPYTRRNPPYTAPLSPWQIQESRVDVVGATIAELRTLYTGTPPGWADADPTTAAPGTNRDARNYQTAVPGTATNNYLSWAKPFIDKSQNTTGTPADQIAWQTREAALTTPVFVPGVSQFIVEFAGDFYDQGPSPSAPTVPEPLGTIDYTGGGIGGPRQIRWYGMPRDLNDDGTLDVRPLGGAVGWPTPGTARWTGASVEKQNTVGAPFIWSWGPTVPGGNPKLPTSPPWTTTAADQGNADNVRPSLVRITLEIIDSQGRLEDGQRIEFVFPLK